MSEDKAELQPRETAVNPLRETLNKVDVKQVSDWITLLLKITSGSGALLLVIYAAKEHFFYDLSSLAAITLLLLAVLAFSLLTAAVGLYGFWILLWVFTVFFLLARCVAQFFGQQLQCRLRRYPVWWYYQIVSIMLFVAVVPIIGVGKHPLNFYIPLLLWGAVSGLVIFVLVVLEPITGTPSITETRNRFLGAVATPFVLLLMFGPLGYMLDRSMVLLSLRTEEDEFITVTAASYQTVAALANVQGIQLSSCEIRKDLWLLRGAALVWHGIGTTSYLRIKGEADRSLLIPLPSADVAAIYSYTSEVVGGGCAGKAAIAPKGD
jgi:hypothetical protein